MYEKKVLITGATGFVGKALVRRLMRERDVIAAVRDSSAPHSVALQQEMPTVQLAEVGEIGPMTNWSSFFEGVDSVVHLAARVHVLHDAASDPFKLYRDVNLLGTKRLAEEASAAGVRRFVFLSSIKVNGEATNDGPWTEESLPVPGDAYAISKHEAEQALLRIADTTGMEVVILRPPLVYGPGVKANFLRLLRWVERGVPLPLASLHNRRSMIYLGNLVDAIATCLMHPAAAGQTFLVSDGNSISTPELVHQMAVAMRRSARLWPFPKAALRLLASLAGRSAEVERLAGSLQVDSSKIGRELGWQPPFTFQQGVTATVAWYMDATENRHVG